MAEKTAGPDHKRPVVLSNRDYDFFYEGLRNKRLLIQKCANCGHMRNPPGPMCPECNSLEWNAVDTPSHGTIYSFTIHRYPPLPDYETPHPVALVELAKGIRYVAPLADVPLEAIKIGMPVKVDFNFVGDMASFRFIPAGEA